MTGDIKEEVAKIIDDALAAETALVIGYDLSKVDEIENWPEEKVSANYTLRQNTISQIHSLYTARIEKAKTEEREKMSEWIDARFSDNITKGGMLATHAWQVYMDEGK